MAFVLTHPVSSIRGSVMLHAGRRAVNRLRARHVLTPQQRADLYVSRMSPAVLAASSRGNQSS